MEYNLKEEIPGIAADLLGGRVANIEVMGGGCVGNVFRVAIEQGSVSGCVIKFVENKKELPYEDEPLSGRVIGSRASNFDPAYALLLSRGLPVPEVYGQGESRDGSRRYVAMQYFAGEPVDGLLKAGGTDTEKLHQTIGGILGRIHSIKRPYQGWAGMESPYLQSWEEAFFFTLRENVERLSAGNLISENGAEAVSNLIGEKREAWEDPKEFSLSHVDGFQGIASKKDDNWNIEGIVDIEDHLFTDPRLALAGYEVSLELCDKKIPASFWQEYSKYNPVDPRYRDLKDLFKLQHLLVWRRVLADLPGQEDDVCNIDNLIKKIASY